MKTLSLKLLLLLLCHNLAGQQTVKIFVDNPEPRVGQEFLLTVESDFFDRHISEKLPRDMSITPGSRHMMTNNVYKTLIASKEGPMTIGPLEFTFNGQTFKSNSITVNVIPPLGDEEGLWIRKVKIEEQEYILLEQILMASKRTHREGNTTTTTWESMKEKFAKLIVKRDFQGLEFQDSHSGSGGHPDTSRSHPDEVSYSYKYYRIVKSDGFNGNFKLKKEHFVNLPDNFRMTEISIN